MLNDELGSIGLVFCQTKKKITGRSQQVRKKKSTIIVRHLIGYIQRYCCFKSRKKNMKPLYFLLLFIYHFIDKKKKHDATLE